MRRFREWRPALWSAWLVCGLIATGICGALPHVEITATVIPIAAIAVIFAGVRRHRPEAPHVWYVVIAAHGMTMLGQLWYAAGVVLAGRVQVPDISSGFFVAAGPVLIVGLGLLVRARTGGRDRAGLIDAAIISTGLAVLAWTFVMRPVAYDTGVEITSRLVARAYPAVDVFVLAMIVRLNSAMPRCR